MLVSQHVDEPNGLVSLGSEVMGEETVSLAVGTRVCLKIILEQPRFSRAENALTGWRTPPHPADPSVSRPSNTVQWFWVTMHLGSH